VGVCDGAGVAMSVGEGVGNGEGLQKGPITNTIAPYEPPLLTRTDSHALQPLCCLWSSFRLMLIMNPTPEPLGIRREPMGSHTRLQATDSIRALPPASHGHTHKIIHYYRSSLQSSIIAAPRCGG
jgi:hypothetical protein